MDGLPARGWDMALRRLAPPPPRLQSWVPFQNCVSQSCSSRFNIEGGGAGVGVRACFYKESAHCYKSHLKNKKSIFFEKWREASRSSATRIVTASQRAGQPAGGWPASGPLASQPASRPTSQLGQVASQLVGRPAIQLAGWPGSWPPRQPVGWLASHPASWTATSRWDPKLGPVGGARRWDP